jgi:DNA-binding beta-propeller fold protein YncE
VDLSTQEPLAAIGVPGTPGELAVAADQRLYVSVRGGAIAVFDVSRLPVASEGTVSTSPWGTVLAGRTADRHRIFTHDATTSLGLTEWDASVAPATQVLTADVCSGPPLVSSSADSATFAFVGAGWPLDGGDVPIFRTADMLRAATLNVEWNPSAVAMCPVTGRVAVAHEDVQVNPTTTAPHHQGTGDLHTFDGRTYVETTRYRLRSHVRPAGIACGPDGSIYLILGADAGTAIGVVAP